MSSKRLHHRQFCFPSLLTIFLVHPFVFTFKRKGSLSTLICLFTIFTWEVLQDFGLFWKEALLRAHKLIILFSLQQIELLYQYKEGRLRNPSLAWWLIWWSNHLHGFASCFMVWVGYLWRIVMQTDREMDGYQWMQVQSSKMFLPQKRRISSIHAVRGCNI